MRILVLVAVCAAGYAAVDGRSVSGTARVADSHAPVITAVLNNYSLTPAGFPNSGIAPGTLFIVRGTGMADPLAQPELQSSAGPTGLPFSLNGASVAVSVNGGSVNPAIYYATAGQIAAVLPSETPAGAGTITVTYNGMASAPFPITVVPSALGFATYHGLAIATNPTTGSLYSYTASIKPGDIIVLWGSGLGAVPEDSDTVYRQAPHASTGPLHLYIGGVQAQVTYHGDSGYPGVNQINVVVPASVPPGCTVSLVAVGGSGTGTVSSNVVMLPVDASGATCSDPVFGTNGATTATLSGKAAVRTGAVLLTHSVSPGTEAGTTVTSDTAAATFASMSGDSYTRSSSTASLGSCAVVPQSSDSAAAPGAVGLDAGAIMVSGPGGIANLAGQSGQPGTAFVQLPDGFIPSSGGSFLFTGNGGPDVGSFSASVFFPTPMLQWTDQSSETVINRASGADFAWTGGAPHSYVEIRGSVADPNSGAGASFFCYAPVAAGSFHVPDAILLTLPAGSGTISVVDALPFTTFTATGLDYAYSFGFTQITMNTTFQ